MLGQDRHPDQERADARRAPARLRRQARTSCCGGGAGVAARCAGCDRRRDPRRLRAKRRRSTAYRVATSSPSIRSQSAPKPRSSTTANVSASPKARRRSSSTCAPRLPTSARAIDALVERRCRQGLPHAGCRPHRRARKLALSRPAAAVRSAARRLRGDDRNDPRDGGRHQDGDRRSRGDRARDRRRA